MSATLSRCSVRRYPAGGCRSTPLEGRKPMPEHTLILLRHAKSDWSGDEADVDRPLAKRGRRQAPAIGRWLAAHIDGIDLAVVSPAARARSTWDLVSAELDVLPPIRIDDRVYAASDQQLLRVVRELPDAVKTVVLVGHNPGLEDLASVLTRESPCAAHLRHRGHRYAGALADRGSGSGGAACLGPATGGLIFRRLSDGRHAETMVVVRYLTRLRSSMVSAGRPVRDDGNHQLAAPSAALGSPSDRRQSRRHRAEPRAVGGRQ